MPDTISNEPGITFQMKFDKVVVIRSGLYRVLGAIELSPKERDELKEFVVQLLEVRTRLKDAD